MRDHPFIFPCDNRLVHSIQMDAVCPFGQNDCNAETISFHTTWNAVQRSCIKLNTNPCGEQKGLNHICAVFSVANIFSLSDKQDHIVCRKIQFTSRMVFHTVQLLIMSIAVADLCRQSAKTYKSQLFRRGILLKVIIRHGIHGAVFRTRFFPQARQQRAEFSGNDSSIVTETSARHALHSHAIFPRRC